MIIASSSVMRQIVVISLLLVVVSSSDLSCLKGVQDKFINYKVQLIELKKGLGGKGQDQNEQDTDQRASGPIDIFASMGKLPGQIANIFGNNSINGITNNLTQMLNNLNLIDQTMQQVAAQIGTIIIPGRRTGQELIKSFLNDFVDTMGAFKDVIKVIKDIIDLVGVTEQWSFRFLLILLWME